MPSDKMVLRTPKILAASIVVRVGYESMGYEFFFSYTRANNDEFLKQFFADLSEAARLKKGLPQGLAGPDRSRDN
jgi:hypothetical protein